MVRVHSGSHRLSARWPPNLHPKQKTCAVSSPVGCYRAHHHHQLVLLLSWHSFYHPAEGREGRRLEST